MPGLLLQTSFFVHPALAGLALAAGAIPFLIHLISRRRYVRLPWAAMAFLLAANRRSLKRLRLEQLLLMLARIAIVVLFGLALARPYFSSASIVPLSSTRVLRVLVFDNSLSMSARAPGGVARIERARDYAFALIEAFPETDPVSLVVCSSPARLVYAQPSTDRRFIREQLAAIESTQRTTDMVGGLAIAVRVLEESEFPPGNRAAYVLSDFPLSSWETGEAVQPTPATSALQRLSEIIADPAEDLALIPITSDEPENVAISAIRAESSLNVVNRPARFDVEVTNFGRSPQGEVVLQVLREGEVIRHEPIPTLEPGETTVVSIATIFPTPGTHLLEATISGLEQDALIEDNSRYLSVEIRDKVPVLLVDGRPGVSLLAGQAGFLATALAPRGFESDAAVIDTQIVSQPELPSEDLSDYGMVALCNVGHLDSEMWGQLESYVSAGGGLLIFMGDLVQVDHYNEVGYRGGTGLMPGSMSAMRRSGTEAGPELGFAYASLTHPAVSAFDGHPESGLFSARVNAYLPVTVTGNRVDVVLRFTDGEPAVIASGYGAGKTVVVTTTANMDWTNLPAKGDYVSLVSGFVAHLVRAVGAHRNLLVGQSVYERLTAVETSMALHVTTPSGESVTPSLVPDDDFLALSFGPVERSGVMPVSIGTDERVFAVNVDTTESELAGIAPTALSGRLGFPVHVIERADEQLNSLELITARSAALAPTLLYVVLALLFIEMWLATQFGGRHAATDRTAQKGSDMP